MFNKPFNSIWLAHVILHHSGNKLGNAIVILKIINECRVKILMRIENVVKEHIKCMETKSLDNQVNKKRNNTGNKQIPIIKSGLK